MAEKLRKIMCRHNVIKRKIILKDWRKCLHLACILLLRKIREDENTFRAAIRKEGVSRWRIWVMKLNGVREDSGKTNVPCVLKRQTHTYDSEVC